MAEASNTLDPRQTDYSAFVSKIHGMITFELMRALDKVKATTIFQDAGVSVTLQQVRAKEEQSLYSQLLGRQVRVTFDRFMESSFRVPENNASTSNLGITMLIDPVALSLAEAVEKDLKALREQPFFSVEPPLLDEGACLASKCTKIFGELFVRTQLDTTEDGDLSLVTTVLYGSRAW